jgi:tocopherol cyclase
MDQVPHRGYHWQRGSDRFFEGWYFRVTLPQMRQSFVFMYAIDDPQGNTAYSGGSAQILGVDEQLIWRTLPNSQDFQADYNSCWLEHWGAGGQGYRVSDRRNQGLLKDPATGKFCQWDYHTTTISTWGSTVNKPSNVAHASCSEQLPSSVEPLNLASSNQPKQLTNLGHDRSNTADIDSSKAAAIAKPRAVMGILSYLPVFEPGWQILQSHAIATGQINWCGQVYQFTDAPAYSEKNWGRTFPDRWFWLQCNSFATHPTLSITAAGGKRELLGQPTNVAMVSIHYQDQFVAFLPEDSQIYCQVAPWGEWRISAHKRSNRRNRPLTWVQVVGKYERPGNQVLVPTMTGLKFLSTDTVNGDVQVKLSSPDLHINARDNQAALEIGGDRWPGLWQFESAQI